jgi:hypothetical protein
MVNLPSTPYSISGRCIRIKGKPVRGLTKTIKKLFAPTFQFSKIKGRKSNVGGLSFRKARRRGKNVDLVLAKWIHQKKKTIYTKLKEARAIIQFLLPYQPLASQFCVAWEEAMIACPLDLLLYNPSTKNFLVVEIKTGCCNRRCSTLHGFLHNIGIKNKVSNSLLHQHQLQTLLGAHLFTKTTGLTNVETLLLYANDKGEVEACHGSDFEVQLNETVLQHVLKSRKKKLRS